MCTLSTSIFSISFSMGSCLGVFYVLHSKTALTFELNILSLVLILIYFAFQIVLNMMNALAKYTLLIILSQTPQEEQIKVFLFELLLQQH